MFLDKSFKLYAPDDKIGGDSTKKSDDIDVSQFKTPDEIELKLNELDSKDGIESSVNSSLDDDILWS